ncbi:pyridoxamine 5'-phosphate oxidase family protein [Hydrogenoanaerobacterium sp.]|uniref:pyridoxamine 5'-phosphate oxidase family protein n=1 Tax=Hydrogenoanaerobacterium sp. TaxID=2953763 RepID=UPI00289A3913|nr:pyridoxamine 5'-phosphate oxidase family protein [Hydrogenoanaerobacterium sp.]
MKPSRRMPREDAVEILKNGKYGVLSTSSEDGMPYGVPINYFYIEEENAIYFHCALKGRKTDNIQANNRVAFVVIGQEAVVEERFTTHYESVMVSGIATFVTDLAEKEKKLNQLCDALTPSAVARRAEVIQKYLPAVAIVKLEICELTGKRNKDN